MLKWFLFLTAAVLSWRNCDVWLHSPARTSTLCTAKTTEQMRSASAWPKYFHAMLKEYFQLCLVKHYCPNGLLLQERKRSCPFARQLLPVHQVQGRTSRILQSGATEGLKCLKTKKVWNYSELQPSEGHGLQLSRAERWLESCHEKPGHPELTTEITFCQES